MADVDEGTRMVVTPTWRMKAPLDPNPTGMEWLGFKVSVDAALPQNVVELRHPETGNVLSRIVVDSKA